ncbi:hypothetical protein [Agromyces humi]|uniref:hypothetical protein n=1 Tax=Agromyces humi TaxID=1766800 RepID=UPI001358E7C9|nr:hypothetical protein [Agromyces humi]
MDYSVRLVRLINDYAPGARTELNDGVVTVQEWHRGALARQLQSSQSHDARTALRLLEVCDGVIAGTDITRLAGALERAIRDDRRADQIRRGRIPGALSAREALDVAKRFGVGGGFR